MEVHPLNSIEQPQSSSYFLQNGYPEWGVDSKTGSKKTSPEVKVVKRSKIKNLLDMILLKRLKIKDRKLVELDGS